MSEQSGKWAIRKAQAGLIAKAADAPCGSKGTGIGGGVPDQRWLDAYGEAVFVCAYKGWCSFELDGIAVTIIESGA